MSIDLASFAKDKGVKETITLMHKGKGQYEHHSL